MLKSNLKQVSSQVLEVENYVESVLSRKLTIFDRLQQVAIMTGNFLQALTDLFSGHLSYHFVPPSVLKKNLEVVQTIISKKYPGHQIVHTDLSYYYNGHHLAHYAYTETHIIIHVQVPFALESSLFNLYSVQSFAVPIDPSNPMTMGYTIIPNLNQYIATSSDGMRYTELTSNQFSLCGENKIVSCPIVHVLRRRPDLTCAASIFYHDTQSFMSLCEPKLFPNKPIPNYIHLLGVNSFLITTNMSEYELSCAGQSLRKEKCLAYSLVQVPCTCSLYIGTMSVTPSLTGCDQSSMSVKISHPVNYALFLSFPPI